MNTNTEVSTKPKQGEDAQTTNLTINWEGMTEDDLRALAQQALIVKLQGHWRKTSIPAELTVKAVDHKADSRAPRLTLEQQIANMSDADKAALIARLTGK